MSPLLGLPGDSVILRYIPTFTPLYVILLGEGIMLFNFTIIVKSVVNRPVWENLGNFEVYTHDSMSLSEYDYT